mmetsp:Transcript_18065/g.72345  ORF Transcript_18065/g.72345 Transcript_18065/m.72345 type:complete len:227 (+) Transcript_18065:100-780(+)
MRSGRDQKGKSQRRLRPTPGCILTGRCFSYVSKSAKSGTSSVFTTRSKWSLARSRGDFSGIAVETVEVVASRARSRRRSRVRRPLILHVAGHRRGEIWNEDTNLCPVSSQSILIVTSMASSRWTGKTARSHLGLSAWLVHGSDNDVGALSLSPLDQATIDRRGRVVGSISPGPGNRRCKRESRVSRVSVVPSPFSVDRFRFRCPKLRVAERGRVPQPRPHFNCPGW